ncbi:hypothetical protein K493DRAFT_274843 [Basidiobolus meristosporus CBS 931.73]|uniref:Uncharacterized protein n=1 Tax=Basidiobolus meristosporus CBS 931.73 TaxID=1314790 RepID=A0A1Y1Z6I9_9FUNG|nr:hypothetical protein K493DRAFT_274843 [Basidiobolus meristosporus CBS 931.73]|eukprot:ORY05607.1 hypothetical protein K493DRAFT_274843 [Basidiobolus meristosporus CBS 931.73]
MGLLDKNRLHLKGRKLTIPINPKWLHSAQEALKSISKEDCLPATQAFVKFLEDDQASWDQQLQSLKTIERLLARNNLKDITDAQIESQIEQLIAPTIIQLYFTSIEVIPQRHCIPIFEACAVVIKKENYVHDLFSQEFQKYIAGNTFYQHTYTNKAVTIYSTLDFALGASIIRQHVEPTFFYLCECLSATLKELEKNTYNDTQLLALSDRVADCGNLTKTILGLLSRHEQFFRDLFSVLDEEVVNESQKKISMVYEEMINSCLKMTSGGGYTRDYGQLAGMMLASLLDLVGPPEKAISLIVNLFFSNTTQESHLKNVVFSDFPNLLTNAGPKNCSELAIYRGFLANLRTSTLVIPIHSPEYVESTVPMLHDQCLHGAMFPKLVGFCDESFDSQIKALAFETLSMWFEVGKAACKDSSKYPIAVQRIRELLTSETQQHVLSYVWNNWDDPVDLVQYKVKDLFEAVLEISEVNSELQGSYDAHMELLRSLVTRLMEMDWYRKVKYALSSSLLPRVGTSLFLEACPDLMSRALLVFHNQVLAPRSSQLIVAFIEKRKEEILQKNEPNLAAWTKLWLVPVCRALSSENELVRKNVSHFLLDRVFKTHPDSFWSAIESLQQMDDEYVSCPQYRMNAMISVIKAGKSLDLIDGHSFHSGPTNASEKKLNMEILREAIHHGDLYLRIDVLGLLCQAHKVTAEVTVSEIDLLKDFLTLNMNHTSPEFRQKFYGHLTKFFIRLRGNLYSMWRVYQSKQKRMEKQGAKPELQKELSLIMEKINNIKSFLVWLCDLSMASLYPGSSYQRVFSALKLFELLLKHFGIDDTPLPNGFVSEHCNAPSFPFRLPLATERNSKILVETLMNPFEANRETARNILFLFPSPLPGIESMEDVQKLLWWGFEAMTSNRANESESGATVFRLLFSKYVEKLGFRLEVEMKESTENHDTTAVPSIDFTNKLLNLLETQHDFACHNLLFAAQNHPMHGSLMALTYIFQDLDYSTKSIKDNVELWRQLHLRTFNLVHSVCSTVLDVLSNPSPEGNMPASFQEIEGAIDDMIQQDDGEGESIGPKHQVILSYCWRAVKEASTLLGILLARVPLNDGGKLPAIMEYDHVVQGGNLLRSLLTTIRHRGAFSAVQPAFISVCSRLLIAAEPQFSAIPRSWLDENLDNILSNSVSITRRSAGLPLSILAIVSSEPADSTQLLNYTMKSVLKIAHETPASRANENSDLPQVHAFNILRTMFSDAKQGTNVLAYVEDAFMLAISGFSSDCWAVRNCSVMLFSTLLQRTFGTKKTKDEHHSMNTLTGKEFFSRFPALHPFLLKELKVAVDQLFKSKELDSSAVHPGLYPVLTLLSRLQPSVMDGSNSALTMSAFVPAVLECAGGSIYKTREMAARALVPLIVSNDLVKTIETLWKDVDLVSQNKLHGRLVQLLSLLRGHLYSVANHEIRKDVIVAISSLFQAKINLLLGINRCSVTRAVFYDIVSEFILEPSWIKANLAQEIHEEMRELADRAFVELRRSVLTFAFEDVFTQPTASKVVDVGRYLVHRHAAKIITTQTITQGLDFVEVTADEVIGALLEDPDYEVRLSTLRTLARLLKEHSEYKISITGLWQKLAQLVYRQEENLECLKIEIELLSRGNFIPVIIDAYAEKRIEFGIRVFWDRLMNMMSSTKSLTVIELTLPLLGSLVNYMWLHQNEYELSERETLQISRTWVTYIEKYSEEAISLSLREAAFTSIQHFEGTLRSRGTANTNEEENEVLIKVYRILVRLLQDDDIDIRQESAQLVSKIGAHWTPMNSERAAEICCRNAAELAPTSENLVKAYLGF